AGLTPLALDGAQWTEEWAPMVTPRQHLVRPLAAACLRLLQEGDTSAMLIDACVAATRLARDQYGRDTPADLLRAHFQN
ncbi:hypothetical protein DKP78_25205, partial [Enterococcus faecium]